MAKSWMILLGITIFFRISTSVFAGTYSGGSGTAKDPIRISTVADWQELIATSADYDKHFILLNDIDFGGMNLTPVASDTDSNIAGFQGTKFTGIFEGSGHVLRDATLNLPSVNYVGLFGFLGIGNQVRNLGVENFNTVGQYCVGGLCGWNEGGTISNANATGTVSGIEFVGGLCGENSGGGTINNCYATGTVSGAGYIVGGLCGGNERGTISNCHAAGTVNGYGNVGGLCGQNSGWGTINNCYANGSISGQYSVGGLCGWNQGGTISNAYATGTATGTYSDIGGLCGTNHEGMITNGYATGAVSGTYSVGGLCGGNYEGTINNGYANGSMSGQDFVGGLVGFNWGLIDSCFATGSVSGMGHVGGLVGGEDYGSDATIRSCFWDQETSGTSDGVGDTAPDPEGGLGKTTAQMMTLSTFTDALWDFVGESANGTNDTWRMCTNGVDYPRLSWEFAHGGDFDCPNGVAMEDLLDLANRWLATNPETIGASDANADGKTDLADFTILAAHWLEE